jgi:DNA-binding Xre family transcriptional regulator
VKRGNVLRRFGELCGRVQAELSVREAILDGEALALDDEGRQDFRALLGSRGWLHYAAFDETGLTVPAVYRLARQNAQMGCVEGTTLDKLCDALEVQPGELLEHIPDKAKRKRG